MQHCEELQNHVLKHYVKFTVDGLLEPIQVTYSLQEGVILIGNDPDEWYADREAVLAFIQAGSGSKLEIEVEELVAFCEGSVGWTADDLRRIDEAIAQIKVVGDRY